MDTGLQLMMKVGKLVLNYLNTHINKNIRVLHTYFQVLLGGHAQTEGNILTNKYNGFLKQDLEQGGFSTNLSPMKPPPVPL